MVVNIMLTIFSRSVSILLFNSVTEARQARGLQNVAGQRRTAAIQIRAIGFGICPCRLPDFSLPVRCYRPLGHAWVIRMVINGRGPDGYLIGCDRSEGCRSFVVETLEMETRCPSCGRRETLVDLTTNSFFMQRASRIAREAKAARLQVIRCGRAAKEQGSMSGKVNRVS